MKHLHIEPLENRTLLSASTKTLAVEALQNSVTIKASTSYKNFDDDEEDDGYYSQITLSWTRSSTTPIDGYQIYRSDDGTNYYDLDQTTASTYTDLQVGTGTRYSYKIRPFTNAAGNQASLGTAAAVTPLPPPGLDLFPFSDHSIGLSTYDDSTNVDHFKFEWAPTGQPFTSANSMIVDSTLEGGATQDDYAETTLANLDPSVYQFRVTAFSPQATSAPTTQTLALIPTPQNVTESEGDNDAEIISWTSNSKHATGYEVQWSAGSDDATLSGSLVVGKNARSAVLTDLAPGIDYGVQVTELAGDNESQPSGAIDAIATTPLDPRFAGESLDLSYTPVLTSLANHTPATASATALQKGGKLIVVGTAHHNFQIVQYNSDGSLDTSFGTDGKVSIDFGGDDSASAVVVQPNHDILVAGTSNNSFAMAELKPNGTLNHTFGHNGRIGYSNGESLTASSLSLAADGQEFFISGIASAGPNHSAIVQEFQSSGQPDPIWDSAAARIPNITGAQSTLAFQSTQKIVLAAQMGNAIVISRFNRDGSPDATFGAGGEQLVHFGKSTQDIHAIAIDPRNDDIILAGSAGRGASSTFAVARLQPNGNLDTTFNSTGPTPGLVQSFVKNTHASAQAVTVLADGKIVAAGTANGNFALAEYTSTGKLDPNFAPDGLFTTDQGSPTDIATALANPNNGSLYLAGTSGPDFSAARYFIDAPTPT